jgi:hypothetical protein
MLDLESIRSAADLAVFGYLDPGTGSYAIQILLATLFGGLFAVRQFWTNVKVWYRSTVGGRQPTPDVEASGSGFHG